MNQELVILDLHGQAINVTMVRLYSNNIGQKQATKNIEDYIRLKELDKLDDCVIYTLNTEKLR